MIVSGKNNPKESNLKHCKRVQLLYSRLMLIVGSGVVYLVFCKMGPNMICFVLYKAWLVIKQRYVHCCHCLMSR